MFCRFNMFHLVFIDLRLTIYCTICEHLEAINHITDTSVSTKWWANTEGWWTWIISMWMNFWWVISHVVTYSSSWSDFRQYSPKNLEYLGDKVMSTKLHNVAISHHSTALSLYQLFLQGVLLEWCKAYLVTRSWKQMLDNTNQVFCSPVHVSCVHPSLSGDHAQSGVARGIMQVYMWQEIMKK